MEKKEQLNRAYKYLMSIGKVHKRQDVADKMNVSKENISRAFNGNDSYLTDSFLFRFNNTFENIFNPDWLLTGEGNMLKEGEWSDRGKIIDNEEDFKKAIESGLKLLPESNFEFSAGVVEIFANTEFIKRYWYLPDCKDCDGVAQISGTSMYPVYPPGCWVALKKVGFDKKRPNEIPFGQVFGVVVEDSRTGQFHGHIKILRRYKDKDLSEKKWIARSINIEEYDDFDIEIEAVRGLWIVKQHIVSDMIL